MLQVISNPLKSSCLLLVALVTVGCSGGGVMNAAQHEPLVPIQDPKPSAVLYVTDAAAATVSAVKIPANLVFNTISVAPTPRHIVVDPNHHRAFVTDPGSNDITTIDTNLEIGTGVIDVNGSPDGIAIRPGGNTLYVVAHSPTRKDNVAVIDTSTNAVVSTIPVGVNLEGDIGITPDGKKLYVTDDDDSRVYVIDAASQLVTKTIPVAGGAEGVSVAPNGRTAYVADTAGGTISAIDVGTDSVTGTLPAGPSPFQIAVKKSCTAVYVTNPGNNVVSVINTTTDAVTTVPVGHEPFGIALAPDSSAAYVVDAGDNTVTVISTTTNASTELFFVGNEPTFDAAGP